MVEIIIINHQSSSNWGIVVSGNPPSTVVGGSMTWEVICAGIINEQQSLFSGVFLVDCGLRFD